MQVRGHAARDPSFSEVYIEPVPGRFVLASPYVVNHYIWLLQG